MATIYASAHACNRSVRVLAYIDTLELFFRYLDPKNYHALVKLARIEAVQHHGRLMGYRVILNQPSKAKLLKLDKLARMHRGIVSRFDIALDISCPNPEALRKAILTTAILRWRRKQPMHDQDGTIPWIKFKLKAGKPRAFRNPVLYSDRPNKVTGE
jgi:hypothetical protein